MELPYNYFQLDTNEKIVTEQIDVVQKLAIADSIIFFDTCIINKLLKYQRIEIIMEYYKVVSDGDVIIVFLESIISEHCKSTGQRLSAKFLELLNKLNEYFTVVLLKEESLKMWRREFFQESTKELNLHFVDILDAHRAQLMTIDKYLKMVDNPHRDIILREEAITEDEHFIDNVISFLKSKKQSKDSLAEQLLLLMVTYIMDCYTCDNQEIKAFHFITNDRKASGRVKDIQMHSDMFTDVFQFVTTAKLGKDIYELELFKCEEEFLEFMEKMSVSELIGICVRRNGALADLKWSGTTQEYVNKVRNDRKFEIVY